MELLFTVHYPVFGGQHNQALRLAEPLRRRGWETLVLLPDEPGSAATRLRDGGVPVVTQPLHRLRNRRDPRLHAQLAAGFPREVMRIRRLIQERQIALVVVVGAVNPHAAIAARLAGVPVVWQILDISVPAVARVPVMRLVDHLADSVMFCSQALMDLYVGSRQLRSPAIVYYPPVDTKQFDRLAERRGATREQFGIPAEAPVVGTVANINPDKGLEYFAHAAGEIYRSHPATRFIVVGERYDTHREYAAAVDAEMERAGIPGDHVIFTGGRSDVENYYPAMDVKLITSVREGAPTTAMEAMACGLPLVATDVGAMREVVDHDTTGLIVPARESGAIARAAVTLLDDSSARHRMGEAGKRRAIKYYDVEVCADVHLSAFDAAIAHHRS